jgi:polyphosphate glucokinase
MKVLGIDIGGSGIKGAIVDLNTGKFISERHRIPTPQPATPNDVANTVKELVTFFNWKGAVGCGFPTIIKNGECQAYGNLHKDWLGVNAEKLFADITGLNFTVINDADAAGLAEMHYGAGKNVKGMVLTITVGTGIGSGAFFNGNLIPNFELGQMLYKDGRLIEQYASDAARKKEDLSYKKWCKRFNYFLNYVHTVCAPDLIILGGGISNKFHKFEKYLDSKTPLVLAQTQNNAGIVGAAVAGRSDF